MAGELTTSAPVGSTVYARIRNAASQLWTGSAFVAPSGTSFAASLKVALADAENIWGVYWGLPRRSDYCRGYKV